MNAKITLHAQVDSSSWPGWTQSEIRELVEQHMKATVARSKGGRKKRCVFVIFGPKNPRRGKGNPNKRALFDSIGVCPVYPCWDE